ncbi:izumo sperm-egg fusion protein 1 [Astyanax mexicanus]|uniref:izumo sperm-egg fusion protein 1 n=1 Tax=Astyanax mexicanus TaxID=7994 RepID=UPI0020CB1093|nr:izumo sperm-egg fusion protein 1 [Astyanax mexicanus]
MFSGSLSFFPLVMVCLVSSVTSCLQCDRAVLNMHEDFIAAAKGVTIQDQMDLKEITDQAYTNYKKTSEELRGVIDPTTLYRARTEYQSEFQRYWKEHKKGPIQQNMINIVEKGNRILKKHLKNFVEEGLCPNTCGLLFQGVMNCSSCQYGLFQCWLEPQQDCGVHELKGQEGEQVVLDCFLSWHSLIIGQAEYHYSWKRGARNFSDQELFEVLVVTEESKIVLNQLSVSEQGVYRCLLLDKHGTELSRMHFILNIIPSPSSTPRPIPTLPALPSLDLRPTRLHRDTLIIILAFLTVVSISASLAIIVSLCTMMMVKRQKSVRTRPKEDEEVQNEHSDQKNRSGLIKHPIKYV